MKKFCRLAILTVLIIALLPMSAFALENGTLKTDVVYFEDGSYITTQLIIQETRSSSVKNAIEIEVYYNPSGIELWRATLTATFIYDGMTSACTDARCDVSITDTNWYVISKTADAVGDTAVANVTMGRKMVGITVERKSVELSIFCDSVGNLS